MPTSRQADQYLSPGHGDNTLGSAESVVAALESHGVFHVWQLMHLSDNDWATCCPSFGLKVAIKAELCAPRKTSGAVAAPAGTADVEQDDRQNPSDSVRRFLLMRTADGQEPERLHSSSAMYYALLTVPQRDRQTCLLCLCEMMALISGTNRALPRPPSPAPSTCLPFIHSPSILT